MVMDTRDYYIKRLRQKLCYTERAAFRMPVREYVAKKERLNIVWRLFIWFFVLVVVIKIFQKLI